MSSSSGSPPSNSERLVADTFAEVLGLERVGATDSFFDVGGNSLSATRVLARLRERAVEIELAWLFSDPTVRGVAARIDGDDAGAVVGEVVLPLRRDGARAPLFCVHPAGGLAWFYGGLAPHLVDRPIYGVQDPHVVTGEPAAESIEELALRYVKEIRQIQPDGPYHLLGWSLGGQIAHAMAVMLQHDGDEVAFLGIMDAVAPAASASTDGVPPALDDAGGVESVEATGEQAGALANDLLGGWRDLFDLSDDVAAATPEDVAAIVREQIAAMGLLREDQVQWVMDSFDAAGRIGAGYRPDVFDGPLSVVTATADKTDPAGVRASWRRHVTGTITNIDVAAHHLGLADAVVLETVGPWLDRQLGDR
ncbi:thioesterase domain-containing protein [Gordonia sp. NPDC003504]